MTVIPFPLDEEAEAMRAQLERWRSEPVELVPRDARNRFRIYRVRGGEQELIATTPQPEGVGVTLCILSEEGEFEGAAVGVLDTQGAPRGSGVWIVNPYERGS